MKFTDQELSALMTAVKIRLSEKRFLHVISVVEAAKKIGNYFPGIDLSELSAAALLHDITKEMKVEEHISLIEKEYGTLSDEDRETVAILHSLSAPVIVKKDFSEYASENVLSAVLNHTMGAPGMSVFDRIIFISDYVEQTRTYDSCVKVRRELYDSLSQEKGYKNNELALNKAVYDSLDFTENQVLKQGRTLNSRSLKTKDYFCGLISKL